MQADAGPLVARSHPESRPARKNNTWATGCEGGHAGVDDEARTFQLTVRRRGCQGAGRLQELPGHHLAGAGGPREALRTGSSLVWNTTKGSEALQGAVGHRGRLGRASRRKKTSRVCDGR